MAAQILLNGSVVVEGEDFQSQTVDFGRPSGQTITLTGSNRWGQTGVSPMSSLRSYNGQVMQASGYNAKVVIMDPGAEEIFIKDDEVKEILDNRANTPIGENFRLGNIQLAGVNAGAVGEEVKYLGMIGEFIVFVYQNTYSNSDGLCRQHDPGQYGHHGLAEGVPGDADLRRHQGQEGGSPGHAALSEDVGRGRSLRHLHDDAVCPSAGHRLAGSLPGRHGRLTVPPGLRARP